ncbi:hypothetical protein JK361_07650 [Streptomyces sp. 5-8]|uniref:RNA polymerase subunit sigma-70 n=1 Tax=Streptomyces musisoli TaxID=2802280 RepID=A0ABS1NWI2_9ACTN|nr:MULTISPECIES: hypothetical protein [Streptomyces]MBL1104472.1 hypothetical protein [Streptomyces musisoli]MBY8840445.1 hypothetical protein [Streptomyces sp. SP2-10]
MGDARCAWCGAALPDSAGAGRRYCHAGHRQAAWRARRRWSQAEAARRTLVTAGSMLLTQVEQELAGMAADDGTALEGAAHCTAVARIPRLTERLVRLAVLADRQAGASWPQIGRALGISGEAARARFTRRGTCEGRPGPGDVPPR